MDSAEVPGERTRCVLGLTEHTISDVLRASVRRFGKKDALIYREDTFTWREVDLLSDLLAERLEGMGVVRGDRVGLWGRNSASWVITFLAAQKLGAVPALLNANYLYRELEQVLRIGGIQWLCFGDTPSLVSQPDLLQTAVRRLRPNLRGLMDIRENALDLRKELGEAQKRSDRKPSGAGCRDAACMLYSTGTSAEPKCVLHSHYSLVNNAIATAERVRMGAGDRICVSQPLFHIFGLITSLLGGILHGATLCVLSRFGSEDILRCVQNHRCTILNGVPTNFISMISNPAFPNYSTDSLRLSIIGGADISATQLDRIREAFPTARILRNYGLTEGCNLCNSAFSDSPEAVSRSVGQPYPQIKLAIQSPETQEFLPFGPAPHRPSGGWRGRSAGL